MNVTVETSRSRTSFKHLMAQNITLACGIAIAVAAAVIATPWQGSSTTTRATEISVGSGYSQLAESPQTIFFLVASETEAARVEAMLSAEIQQLVQPVQAQVALVTTPEEAAQFNDAVRALMLNDVLFQIADLRPAAPVVVVASESSDSKTAKLEATMIAGAFRSERATWALSTAARPMFSTAADAEHAAAPLVSADLR